MKKSIYLLLLIASTLLLPSCSYNSLVSHDEAAKKAWADVEAAYQRRSDLIGNLVETVKGEAKFEKETLVAVVDARSKATSIQLKADEITPENMAKFQEAQSQLSGALSRLLVVAEQYPNLKATEAFQNLMNELERTENRINIARRDYNEAVQNYNTQVRSFPSNITANLFKFKQREPFKADPGTEKAPKVQF
ncbi:MAG: LemA family protein [Chitinophagales bacterium]|nr:LemA family protein [Chitinophagales bacterium]